MNIGAQLYTVRDKCKNNEDLRATFGELKKMGYTSVQVSGFDYDAQTVRDIADEFGLHIGLTHTGIEDIIQKTDEVINKHKILGADVVGIGSPEKYRVEDDIKVDEMISDLAPAVEKIEAAGLKVAFHNHYVEFYDRGGYTVMDVLYEKTSWNFILDTAWVHYAGDDVVEVINKYKDRLKYVHIKDYSVGGDDIGAVVEGLCPLYEGKMPMDEVMKALEDVGTVEIAYVEQDNGPNKENSLEEMRKSINALKAKGWI